MDSDKTTRRNFIKLAALLGVGLYTANAAAEASCGGKCFDIARINRTRKPENLRVSAIGFGCM